MINHVRTLLLNQPRQGRSDEIPGEEYIPASFVPRVLPPALRGLWETLFGSRSDRAYRNYRGRQFMQLLHASPLAEDVLLPDSRVTYLPFKPWPFALSHQPQVTPLEGTETLHFVGREFPADELRGRMLFRWEIALNGDTLQVEDLTVPGERVDTVSVSPGIPARIPRTPYRVLVPENATYGKWRVSLLARPAKNIAERLFAARGIVQTRLEDVLFPPLDPGFQKWRHYWTNSDDSISQYAAMLLGLARAIERQPGQPS